MKSGPRYYENTVGCSFLKLTFFNNCLIKYLSAHKHSWALMSANEHSWAVWRTLKHSKALWSTHEYGEMVSWVLIGAQCTMISCSWVLISAQGPKVPCTWVFMATQGCSVVFMAPRHHEPSWTAMSSHEHLWANLGFLVSWDLAKKFVCENAFTPKMTVTTTFWGVSS